MSFCVSTKILSISRNAARRRAGLAPLHLMSRKATGRRGATIMFDRTAILAKFPQTEFWMTDHPNIADLGGADLRGALLRDADLSDADLSDAYLRGADLGGADLGGADLSDADLSDAYLRGAYLGGALLRDALLRGAYLRGAYLGGAILRGADLRNADLRGALLRDALLRGATLNIASHDLVAEILRQSAGSQIKKLMIAGLVLVDRNQCWPDFADGITDTDDRSFIIAAFRPYPQLIEKLSEYWTIPVPVGEEGEDENN